MKTYRKRVTLFLLTVFLCSLLTIMGDRTVWAQKRVDRGIYYQTLNRLEQTPETMIIYVGGRQFTITKETPVLFERAHKLLKKKVQVIYNKKNNQVINLFSNQDSQPY
ncbi:MAG: hypothetical protein J7L25_06155 [Deltaproteobacteria bacterium]|nr:hypothetical protein [Candidatus Tharpella aukensis]